MHLAYFDETGTDGHSPIAMFGALVVPVGKFGRMSILHSAAIQQILPPDRIDEFKEFHAYQLYRGTDIFEGIDETKRFTAIRVLLMAVEQEELPFIYAAADRKAFMNSPFGSHQPLSAAFHMSLLGIEDWATNNHPNWSRDTKQIDWKDTYLCILDDFDDKKKKDELGNIYRTLRAKHPFVPNHPNRLWHGHDCMFFANSLDSIGVQISDLCNYFVRLRLSGEPEPQHFYDIFSKHVICAKPDPEWKLYGQLFRSHDAIAGEVSDGKRIQ